MRIKPIKIAVYGLTQASLDDAPSKKQLLTDKEATSSPPISPKITSNKPGRDSLKDS